ncbi:MAG: hypothetical protein USCAAHI_02465 [Beijerinckiaceae bacterium]|nr:MAG: hypothetical protein USCAAHI_02465 [Beijerinckiaceae bacterium]
MLTAAGASVSKSMAKEYHMARKKGRIQDVAAAEALAKEGQMSETNEDTGLAAEDTIFAAEDTGPRSVEETIVETSVDPVAGIVEAALAEDFEVLEELGKEGLKAAKSAASSFSGSFRMFATETRDYTKNCFESRAAFVGALLDAKSLQSAVRIQTGYAVSARARFLAHAMQMSALYWSLLGEAFKPIEKVTAKADRAKA